MKSEKTMSLRFYQNLGKLFYAVAAVDKTVREQEINELKKLVKKEWLSVDDLEDEFGTDAAYQIAIVFDWLINNEHPNSATYYNDFISYKQEQEHLFTKKVKQLIFKTAQAIAESFSGKNKSELMLLAKLSMDLNIKKS
ncbi:hypothetical protein [Mangrovimonas spongiae]|uniref:TerB family tellurite resistance protein n=1 Tax=Mangrovimonas spongiae TaxID=2494697 RepID=A0A3R9NS04_9FLAO|nr:hypothetical protein [Mangrovimonas spongiae]RSK40427.1 hypothetical protein EJA19_05455 [Mangrovimonas spongiae]